jgi:glycerol-3-phosphate acyltransferase PlsX
LIALDAVGGDRAPGEAVAGAIEAARRLRMRVALVGPTNILESELARHNDVPQFEIVEASQVISMDEPPTQAVRQKRDASINVAMRMLKDGEAEAVVSAGNTGALVASALLNLGRLSGVHRPAIGALLPSTEHGVLLLDAGANAQCKPSYLVQFAYMGAAYMERMFGIDSPRVALLNIGEEENKGNDLAQDVYRKLEKGNLNFVGNVEGKDIARGTVDVVVTDGFTGNVAVKMSEASVEFVLSQMKRVLSADFRSRLAGLALRDSLRGIVRRMDYSEYGGVPLLGVNGIVIAAHGRSDANAFKNALRIAKEAVSAGILEALAGIPRR